MDGICDCHMHVFGPPDRYPGSPNRAYTPTEKGLKDYQPLASRVGIERVVIVQPSAYGLDNRCTLDALQQRRAGTCAVVVVDPAVAADELTTLDRMGARGVRLNAVNPGGVAAEGLDTQVRTPARRIEHLLAALEGWMGNATVRRRILVDNAVRLYRF